MMTKNLIYLLIPLMAVLLTACDATLNPDGDTDGDNDSQTDGDAPDPACQAGLYVCQGNDVYHCNDGEWAYFLNCADQGDYVCNNGLCVAAGSPDGDVPDGDVPDGDWPDGDVPDGDWPDGDAPGCSGTCDPYGDLVIFCTPEGWLCSCENGSWVSYDCDLVCAAEGQVATGCGYHPSYETDWCTCEPTDGDVDDPGCAFTCERSQDCPMGQVCGAGGCCTAHCSVTGCPDGGACNQHNGYCEWCDTTCPVGQCCNYTIDFWYCGSCCVPPCDEGFACRGGACTPLSCPNCDRGEYCGPETGFICEPYPGCSGACDPDDTRTECMGNLDLCACDADTHTKVIANCHDICRENGFSGAESCEYSEQAGGDVCYCYNSECQSDQECLQTGTGDYCITMGQNTFCAPRCDLADCGGGIGCIDLGIGDGCGMCLDFDHDAACQTTGESCGTSGICHDICGLYDTICSAPCDAIPNSCNDAGELCWPLGDGQGNIVDGICINYGANCPDCAKPDGDVDEDLVGY